MRKIILFITITLLITGLFHGLLAVLTQLRVIDFESVIGTILFIIGGSAPTVVAIVLIVRYESIIHRQSFFRSMFSFSAPIHYWIVALVFPLFLGSMFHLMYRLINEAHIIEMGSLIDYGLFVLSAIVFGGLEEVGWRGYLLPRLRKYLPLTLTTLIIGIIWGLWHLPLFYVVDSTQQTHAFLPYMLSVVMFSTYLTMLYMKTTSILLLIIAHAAINATFGIGLGLILNHSMPVYLFILIVTIIGFIIIHIYDKQLKSRSI